MTFPIRIFIKKTDNPVYELFLGKVDIQQATAFLQYEKGNKVQKLIHSFKYHGNKELAYLLGKLSWHDLADSPLFKHIDLIIPVPLHKKRQRKRGYNQAEYIAKGIRQVSGLPVRTDILYREIASTSQVKKNIYDRWNNMQELFTIKNEQTIQGNHVLLVDDVVTSGSTLCACATKLLSIKDVQVSIFTLAKAGTVFSFTPGEPTGPSGQADKNH